MNNIRNILVLDENAHVEEYSGTVFIARVVKAAPKFSIAASIATGSGDDIIPGTAHLKEHLRMESTENFKDLELSNYMQARKGYCNAVTSVRNTVFFGEVDKGYEKDAIFAISDLTCRFVPVEWRFLKEIETVLNECADDDMDFGRQLYFKSQKAAFGANGPKPVIGSEESIESISMKDVLAFEEHNYFADRLFVAMEGDFDPHEMLDEAKRKFVLPRGSRETKAPLIPFDSHTEMFPTDNHAVTAAFVFPSWLMNSPAAMNERASNELFESVLLDMDGPALRKLRFDKQSLYGITAPREMRNSDVNFAHRAIAFHARVKKVVDIVKEMPEIIRGFIESPDEALFQKVKDIWVSNQKTRIERNPEVGAFSIAVDASKCRAIWPADAYLKALERTTIDDLKAFGRRYMSGQDVSLMYRGNVQPNFPTHEDVAKILRGDGPTRTAQTDARLTASPSGNPEPKF